MIALPKWITGSRFDAEKKGNFIRDAWDRLQGVPFGTKIFSQLIKRAVPYSGTIDAEVVELRQGYARVVMKDRPQVRNHLRSVHAIALANLAELCGNIAVMYSLRDDQRFIVAGFDIEYLKKARGTMTAESLPPAVPGNERQEVQVEVLIKDDSAAVCAKVRLRTLIGPKKD